jgi:hypothetical protein
MKGSPPQSALDRPLARVAAALVVLAVAGVLLRIHWDDLFPPPRQAAEQGTDAYRACLDKRLADIAAMREQGVVGGERAELFRQRAEAYCRAREGGAGVPAGPMLPGD